MKDNNESEKTLDECKILQDNESEKEGRHDSIGDKESAQENQSDQPEQHGAEDSVYGSCPDINVHSCDTDGASETAVCSEGTEGSVPQRKKRSGGRAADIARTALFVAVTIVLGFIKIPMQPVAITLLTLATTLAGCFLTPLNAFMSQLIYVIIGLAGIPVFTNGGGISYVLQPSFGFLLVLPAMAWAVSVTVRHDSFIPAKLRLIYRHFAVFAISAVMLVAGTLYYFFLAKFYLNTDISMKAAFMSCFVIFLPGTLIKSVTSVILFDMLKKRLRLV